jgi:hypothetical protein
MSDNATRILIRGTLEEQTDLDKGINVSHSRYVVGDERLQCALQLVQFGRISVGMQFVVS